MISVFLLPHAMDHKLIQLKLAWNKQEFTHWKNILIVINFEILPADYLTKKFILNPVYGNVLVPTKNKKLQQVVLGWDGFENVLKSSDS
jgi:hypothetical protein